MKKITFAALAVPLMWVLLLLLFSNYKVYAQEHSVLSGVVKTADGTPLEGVTVWQKDTDNGTQTNEQGFYTLSVIPSATITFEYLGFKTQHLKASTNVLNVTMQTDDDTLEELVINAGYYSVKDKERTGSISKITSKEIGQQPVANPLAAMQGRMAGVNITQSSGTPGGGFDIQIRGRNSLRTEGNAPLYIVDGVPYGSQSVSDNGISSFVMPLGNVSPLNSINPNDIESIEVLKDADATAIYGSRGSNGVVLITTKKGSSNKTTFSLQSTTSVSTVSNYMDLMSTEQYLQMRSDAFANDGIAEYPEAAYDVNGTWNSDRQTDWQREFIGGKAVSQNLQFSIGGGSGKTSYLFSASHRKDGTVFPGDFGYKRTNFSLNVNHKSKDERFGLKVNVLRSEQRNNLMAADFSNEMFLSPNAPGLKTVSGNLNWEDNTFDNPLAKLYAVYLLKSKDVIGQLNLDYKLSDALTFRVNAGMSDGAVDEWRTAPSKVYNPALEIGSDSSVLTFGNNGKSGWIVEPQLHWEYANKNSRWNILLGTTFEERQAQSLRVDAGSFTTDDFIFNAANAAIVDVIRDTESRYRYMAMYGRLNYIYKDKYIANVTGRRDGSSRFGANNRFANFGAAGLAWLFGREKIFDESTWLTFGKLRGSYGIAGSDLIGDYQYLNNMGVSRYQYDGITGIEPIRLFNPDFSWENNKKLEAALELEFFHNRISASAAWYRNRSSNQLVGIPLPGTTGFNSLHANLNATVENSGWEFTVNSSNISNGRFSWTTALNFTIPRNKLIAFPNLEESTYKNQYVIGESVNVRKLLNYTGINRETGLYDFEDVNRDGVIDVNDRQSVADIGPRYLGGLHNSFSYKGWSLDFLFQVVIQKVNAPDYYSGYLGMAQNKHARAADYFSQDNPDALYQKPTSGSNALAIQANQNFKNSTGIITDGSFVRLKNVQLQYSLGDKWFKDTSCSIYVQAINLITFTRYWGLDPESMVGFMPNLRTVAVGFNIQF